MADQNQRDLLLSDHQWKLAEKLVTALEFLEVATTTFGGEKYCTFSLVAPVVHGLLEQMDDLMLQSSATSSIGQFHRCISAELKKKFPTLTNALSLHAMCSALDPRFRDLSFLSAESAQALQKNFTQLLTVEVANADDNAGEPSAKNPCVSQPSGLSKLLKRTVSMPKSASAQIEREVNAVLHGRCCP